MRFLTYHQPISISFKLKLIVERRIIPNWVSVLARQKSKHSNCVPCLLITSMRWSKSLTFTHEPKFNSFRFGHDLTISMIDFWSISVLYKFKPINFVNDLSFSNEDGAIFWHELKLKWVRDEHDVTRTSIKSSSAKLHESSNKRLRWRHEFVRNLLNQQQKID